MLCVAATTDTGAMWECPLLLELQELPDVLRPLGLGRRGCSSMRSRSESFRSVHRHVSADLNAQPSLLVDRQLQACRCSMPAR